MAKVTQLIAVQLLLLSCLSEAGACTDGRGPCANEQDETSLLQVDRTVKLGSQRAEQADELSNTDRQFIQNVQSSRSPQFFQDMLSRVNLMKAADDASQQSSKAKSTQLPMMGGGGMPGAMPGGMPQGMPGGMMQGGMPGMQGGMPGGMPGMQGGMAGGMPGGMQGGMLGSMPGGMPGSMPQGMPMSAGMQGMMQGGGPRMQEGMPGGMLGMQGGMPGGMPGMPGAMLDSMQGVMPGGMPMGGMPQGMPMSAGMPGAMPMQGGMPMQGAPMMPGPVGPQTLFSNGFHPYVPTDAAAAVAAAHGQPIPQNSAGKIDSKVSSATMQGHGWDIQRIKSERKMTGVVGSPGYPPGKTGLPIISHGHPHKHHHAHLKHAPHAPAQQAPTGVMPGAMPGYGQGFMPGYTQGYGQGYFPGYGQGYAPGYGQGYAPGYGQNYAPGYGQGYMQGYAGAYPNVWPGGVEPGMGVMPEAIPGYMPPPVPMEMDNGFVPPVFPQVVLDSQKTTADVVDLMVSKSKAEKLLPVVVPPLVPVVPVVTEVPAPGQPPIIPEVVSPGGVFSDVIPEQPMPEPLVIPVGVSPVVPVIPVPVVAAPLMPMIVADEKPAQENGDAMEMTSMDSEETTLQLPIVAPLGVVTQAVTPEVEKSQPDARPGVPLGMEEVSTTIEYRTFAPGAQPSIEDLVHPPPGYVIAGITTSFMPASTTMIPDGVVVQPLSPVLPGPSVVVPLAPVPVAPVPQVAAPLVPVAVAPPPLVPVAAPFVPVTPAVTPEVEPSQPVARPEVPPGMEEVSTTIEFRTLAPGAAAPSIEDIVHPPPGYVIAGVTTSFIPASTTMIPDGVVIGQQLYPDVVVPPAPVVVKPAPVVFAPAPVIVAPPAPEVVPIAPLVPVAPPLVPMMAPLVPMMAPPVPMMPAVVPFVADSLPEAPTLDTKPERSVAKPLRPVGVESAIGLESATVDTKKPLPEVVKRLSPIGLP